MEVVTQTIKENIPKAKPRVEQTKSYLNYFKINPIVKPEKNIDYMEEYKDLLSKKNVNPPEK